MEHKNEVSAYLENISILLLGLVFLGLPLLFTTLTTDPFTLPKQIFLIGAGLILLLLSGARMISEGSVRISRTPFNIPVAIFGLVIFVSSVLSINFYDSLTAMLPILFAVILFFLTVNLAKNRPAMTFLLTTFITGISVSALINVLSFAKIYVLPVAFTKDPNFTTLGTILDQGMYLVLALPIIGFFIYQSFMHIKMRRLASQNNTSHASLQTSILTANPIGMLLIATCGVITIASLGISLYSMLMNHPVILPFEVGFQTALASISQDAGRNIQAFLFGSGYGTYNVDFSRFKLASFNLNPTLWSLTFFRSSSYMLELLSTTGILGFLSFLFILWTIFKEVKTTEGKRPLPNPLTLSVILAGVSSIILPFSPILVITFFMVLALFAAEKRLQALAHSEKYYDVELHFVAFNMGVISMMPLTVVTTDHKVKQTEYTKVLPVAIFLFFAVITALTGFATYSFAASDIIFQRSLVAASQNNGLQTYQDQANAIHTFGFRDAYYRIASQTDLALANSLASSVPAGSSPSAQLSQNITQLIQESIATSRAATQLAPLTAANWQNLSGVYRGLIGFGQNAEQFAIAAQQQAIALNPNDPQGYVNLGGIYFQLQAWDNAQQSFQTAVSLKPDYANAYYNLGHALEAKGDMQGALTQYQTVEQLVAADKTAADKMAAEIKTLEGKISSAQKEADKQAAAKPTEGQTPTQQQPVSLNQPQTQLPAQKNPSKLPGTETTVTPSPAPSVTPAQ